MEKHIDSLTGLSDRKALEINLTKYMHEEENVAVAFLDVDHFKEINDDLGSAEGDKVLQALASILSNHFPEQAYRVSGDEFAILLPDYSLEQAFLKMETIRAKVADNQNFHGLPKNRQITLTVGVAQHPRDAKDFESLTRAAESALMTAKEIGRNQVALPPNEEMVLKSCYYSSTSLRRLKALAEIQSKKESILLREALEDLLRKYDKR
ncbi:MAG: hypothetical protein JWN30_2193 [Bacilli bacterium]|nr:hypothetical protein [Bacilli bacterium]